MLQIYDELSLI